MIFNYWGLVLFISVMIQNIIYAVRCPEGFENRWNNKIVQIIEQVGRYSCIVFMILIVPIFGADIPDGKYLAVYLSVDFLLVILYSVCWYKLWNRNDRFRALALSIIPSLLFLFSGIMTRYILLIAASLIFAPAHITVSVKNSDK